MPGIKGQKWSADKRRPVKVKQTIQLTEPEMAKVKQIAGKKDWSISKTLYNIITGKISHI